MSSRREQKEDIKDSVTSILNEAATAVALLEKFDKMDQGDLKEFMSVADSLKSYADTIYRTLEKIEEDGDVPEGKIH